MAKEKAVLVLANNMNFFKLMVDNLPDSIDDFTFIVVNETRIGDKTSEIRSILENSKCKDYKVFTSDLINQKFKAEVIDNEFVEEYGMSMNILSLWFVFKYNKNIKKILLLDDDVILREGFEDLFKTNHHLFKYNRLSAGPSEFSNQSSNAIAVYEEWFKIFDIEFSDDWWSNVYIKRYANSGQRLIVRKSFDLERYERQLKKFFESEVFLEFWRNRRTHCSWFFDERFETFFFLNELNDDLNKSTYLILTRPEKMNDGCIKKMKKSSIIHNATNSHKNKVYNLMIEKGVIVGDKL